MQNGDGIVERFGPQMVPLKARGIDRLDVRVHAIDPLDRAFWPFPEKGVTADEEQRPPSPGEEPKAWDSMEDPSPSDIAERIAAFGSPSLSELVSLPVGKGGATTSIGLNLRPYLQRLGNGRAGHYLIGIRRLDNSSRRDWMRVKSPISP